MSFEAFREDEVRPKRGGKLRGVAGSSGETADKSGGRSTGNITGFGGGRIQQGSSRSGGGGGGGQTKAVVKGGYVKAGNTKSIKASARYYGTRENDRGERMEREAFSRDSENLDRKEIYERLERADREHAYHYRWVVSPGTDENAEGIDLKDYTRKVIEEVERQQGRLSLLAWEHAGDSAHTDRAHVHTIVSTNEKLNEKDFERLRDHATRSWAEAREDGRFLERDVTMRGDIKALGELSERQREAKRERETGQEDPSRKPLRKAEREEVKRDTTIQKDNVPGAVAEEEREYSRSHGRNR